MLKGYKPTDMSFAIFIGRQLHQCLEWIPIQDGHPVGDRSMTEDNTRFVARMQKDGNDFVGYFYLWLYLWWYDCLSNDDNGRIRACYGHPCQYLRIQDSCTVMYVNYEYGTALPHNAVIGGYTADGIPVTLESAPITISSFLDNIRLGRGDWLLDMISLLKISKF